MLAPIAKIYLHLSTVHSTKPHITISHFQILATLNYFSIYVLPHCTLIRSSHFTSDCIISSSVSYFRRIMAASATEQEDMKKSFPIVKEGSELALSISDRRLYFWQVALRVLAIVFGASAIGVIVTSDEEVLVYGIEFDAKYSYSAAYKFLVGADAVICACAVLSLITVISWGHPRSDHKYHFAIFFHDLVMMVLEISGFAAASAIGWVAVYGQDEIGWTTVCDHAGKFCVQVFISLVFSFLAFLVFFILTIMSTHKLKQDLELKHQEMLLKDGGWALSGSTLQA